MKLIAQSIDPIQQSLIDQIAAIRTMLPGTLAEEYRQAPSSSSNNTKPLGPYFKHQCWKDGRNVSRRVPADEAAQLREDIDNARHFHQFTAQLNINDTLSIRAAETPAVQPDAKKYSSKQPRTKNSAKPKPSSPKPKPA